MVQKTLLILSRLLTVNPNPAFLDSREYLKLAGSSWQVALRSGHPPIHPGYVAVIKLGSLLGVSASMVSALAGIGTVIIFYFLIKDLWDKKTAQIAALILALLPGVWIVQENVMVESVSFWWLTLAIYLAAKQRWVGTGMSLTLMLLTHNQMLLWLPLMFAFTRVKKKVVVAAILAAALVYSLLGQDLLGLVYTKTGEIVPWWQSTTDLLRYLRNNVILWLRLHTNLVGLVAVAALWQRKRMWLAMIPYLFWSQFYSGDFLIRRLIPVTLVTSLAVALVIKNRWWLGLLILNLVIASVPVVGSYSWLNRNQVINKLHRLQAQIPKEALYIDSHFGRTINSFTGEIYHLGEPSNTSTPLQAIEVALKEGRRVFIDAQAMTDPYQFYVGNQLHPLSLGKFGQSEARQIFRRFYIKNMIVEDAEKRIFAYELTDEPVSPAGQAIPGAPILVYSQRWPDRLLRQRLDYFDPLTWLWALATNKREPQSWVYADAAGKYILP